MERLSLLEKSNLFRNALLATKVSQVLRRIEKNNEISDSGYAIIKRGADMLEQIIQGSLLIERTGPKHGFSPSQEGLSAYGHALSAANKIQLIKQEVDFADLFIELHEKMISLSKGEYLESETVSVLNKFFVILSELFSEDIQKEAFQRPLNQKITFHHNRTVYRGID